MRGEFKIFFLTKKILAMAKSEALFLKYLEFTQTKYKIV